MNTDDEFRGFTSQGENTKGDPEVVYHSDSFAAQLLKHGSDPNAIEPESGRFIGVTGSAGKPGSLSQWAVSLTAHPGVMSSSSSPAT